MSCILHIETSTTVCSVAVSEDGQNIFTKEDFNGPSHAVSLGVFVDEALSFADSHAMPVDAVAVSCGPGSYTGLRIGVSMAKGVCYGRGIPLIGIPTLKVQCVPVLLYHDGLPDDALLCPMIDARRMEVYAAIYDRALAPVRDIAADTGYDLSVISRATAGKYVATPSGVYPVKMFFNERPFDDTDASSHEISEKIKSIIAAEDKSAPLSDEALRAALTAEGYDIARRTVAKYREKLGLPVARLRRNF